MIGSSLDNITAKSLQSPGSSYISCPFSIITHAISYAEVRTSAMMLDIQLFRFLFVFVFVFLFYRIFMPLYANIHKLCNVILIIIIITSKNDIYIIIAL